VTDQVRLRIYTGDGEGFYLLKVVIDHLLWERVFVKDFGTLERGSLIRHLNLDLSLGNGAIHFYSLLYF
jgi:hypothetical protein